MDDELLKQFDYKVNANLVLTSEHNRRPVVTDEVKSLRGRIVGHMGDIDEIKRASRRQLGEEKSDKKKESKRHKKSSKLLQNLDPSKGLSSLDDKLGSYQPSESTSASYTLIINFVQRHLGFQPDFIIDGAAQEVIATMKNPKLDEETRRQEVGELLSMENRIEDDEFNELCNLTKKIDDWNADMPVSGAGVAESDFPMNTDKDGDDESTSSLEFTSDSESDDDDDDVVERAEAAALDLENGKNLLNLPQPEFTIDPRDIPGVEEPTLYEGYKEYYVKPKKKMTHMNERKIHVDTLSRYEQIAFEGIKTLNTIQSAIYDSAMKSDQSLLICAPTGAGKTNIAMLTMLREILKHEKEDGTGFHLDKFKIIYIAPIKALVQEVVNNFSERLGERTPFKLRVDELTGDHQLDQRQISQSQIIVCTPEKWDIVTRKSIDRLYTKLVKLVIFDEIHLLHNERGATLEALVARIKRHRHIEGEPIRIVGLSATLSNYKDVSRFISTAESSSGSTFYFDSSYRPIPLHQRYIALSETKRSYKMIDDIVYSKVINRLERNAQILIFVHSRPDTVKTADYIKTKAHDEGKTGLFIASESAIEIIDDYCQNLKPKIKELVKFGIGTHHAGMTKDERTCIEELFRKRYIKVLVSTATLAWGVNLPARTVIIKGTQVYRDGQWTDLDSLDVTQMLGRAGRPRHDDEGEGIVITQQQKVGFYMSLMTEQLPVESRLIARLADFINAECVIGNIESLDDAARWISETFLNSRMLTVLNDPKSNRYLSFYGIDHDARSTDPNLKSHRRNLAFSSASVLDSRGLIIFDRKSGAIKSTELGRIASHYNCSSKTAQLFMNSINEHMSDDQLFRVFSLSEEFKDIYIRKGEENDLKQLIRQVPFPIDEAEIKSTGAHKVNALLQVYIFRMNIEGSTLISDMHFIKDNASRLARAIHEIVLFKGYAHVAEISFDLCRKIDKRMTICHTPLRQLADDLDPNIVDRLERKNYQLNELLMLDPQRLTELIRCDKRQGIEIHNRLKHLPKLKIEAIVKPLTQESVRLELTVLPEFVWNENYNGYSEKFWLLVQDVNQEALLHHEMIYIRRFNEPQETTTSFTVPFLNQPFYFIRIFADNWFGCDHHLPVHLEKLSPPEDTKPQELVDTEPLNVESLSPSSQEFYPQNFIFNQIQTKTFKTLYESSDDVILLAPAGSGKTLCAEFAILQIFERIPGWKCAYISANEHAAQSVYKIWSQKFGDSIKIELLTGNRRTDLTKADGPANIVIGYPSSWHSLTLTRSKKYRKLLDKFDMYIIDDIHMLASDRSSVLEWLCSKLRIVTKLSSKRPPRLIALGSPVACADNFKSWLAFERNKTEPVLFNFPLSSRPLEIEFTFQKYSHYDYKMRLLTMQRPVYRLLTQKDTRGKPAFIFVADYHQALSVCDSILNYCNSEGTPFGHVPKNKFVETHDPNLAKFIRCGIGLVYCGMSLEDKELVEHLFEEELIVALVATVGICWSLQVRSYLTVIMDTQQNDGIRQTDYDPTDIMQMVGLTGRPLKDNKCHCVIMCQSSKVAFYERFVREPLPIESDLPANLISHVNYEVATESIVDLNNIYKPYLAHTFFYKRISVNPNYYGLIAPDSNEEKFKVFGTFFNELVNKVAFDLEENEFLSKEGTRENPTFSPGLLSKISLEYYISYDTLAAYFQQFKKGTDIRTLDLIELIATQTFEFSSIPIRNGELQALKRLQRRHRPHETGLLHDSTFKVQLLILSQYQKTDDREDPVEGELIEDRRYIISFSYRLLMAIVDIAWVEESFQLAKMTIQLAKKLCLFSRDSRPNLEMVPCVDEDGDDDTYIIEIKVTRQDDPFSESEFQRQYSHSVSLYRNEGWFLLLHGRPSTNNDLLLFERVKAPSKGDNIYKLCVQKKDVANFESCDLYMMSDCYSSREDRRVSEVILPKKDRAND